MRCFTAVAAIASVLAAPAGAQDAPVHLAAGSTGITRIVSPELSYRITSNISLRASTSFAADDPPGLVGDPAAGRLKLRSAGAMIDFHPFDTGFRISAGARRGEVRARRPAVPAGNAEIARLVDAPAASGAPRTNAESDRSAPTFTLGWDGRTTAGMKFGVEAGATLQDRPGLGNLDDGAAGLGTGGENKIRPLARVSLSYSF